MQAAALQESLRTRLNLTASEGLLVVHVEPGSPAEKAGILLGDVLVNLADEAVADTESAQRILRRHKAGDAIAASLVRGGAMINASVKLEARAA
jgi:S1-C subfamily serine protease